MARALRSHASADGAPESGPRLVTRWDLDKTYLRSDFYTFSDLMSAAFERPDQKRPVPGASRLLAEFGQTDAHVHILSGSPEQMRRALSERLAMDGARFDELTLKPNLRNLLRLRFRALKEQLGYKLQALLRVRAEEAERGVTARAEVLVGDDSEADAFVYSLYVDLVRGRVDVAELERILDAGEVFADEKTRTLAWAERARGTMRDVDSWILIHLDRQTPPSRFARYGARLVPFFNYAQAAFVLFDRRLLDGSAVFRIVDELLAEHRFDLAALARSYWDLRRRNHVGGGLLEALRAAAVNETSEAAALPEAIVRDPLEAQPRDPLVAQVPFDYVTLAREHRGGRNRR